MRYLAILGSAAMLALAGGGSAGAAILCVSPDIASCFDTIQEAVDAAAPGDTISIRGKRDRTAYNEAVTIATDDLTIQGQGASPTFRSVADIAEFGALRPVDLDDPDVQEWLESYPDADEFLETVAALEAFIQEDALIDRCPPVVVEVCATPETGPGICGVDRDAVQEEDLIPVFQVEASGTSFANLSLRHGSSGIRLAVDATDTTIERMCFRNNNLAVESVFMFDDEDPVLTNNHRTTIRQNFVDGAALFASFGLFGDDIVIERNLVLNAEGFLVFGNGLQASFNAIAGTHSGSCLRLEGADGLISHNVAVDCAFNGVSVEDAVDTIVLGNLVDGLPDESGGIFSFGIPENSDDPEFPGNLRTVVRHNIIRLTSGSGMDIGASQALIEGNLVDRAGNDPGEAGIVIEGNGNQVLHNLVRNSGFSAIHVHGPFFDVSQDEDVPSSGNLIQGNVLTRNHTAGVLFEPGEGGVASSDDTTVDGNLITLSDGEGVALPVGDDGLPDEPAATDVTLSGNTFEDNRTDVCDESAAVVDGGGNVFGGTGIVEVCIVEPSF